MLAFSLQSRRDLLRSNTVALTHNLVFHFQATFSPAVERDLVHCIIEMEEVMFGIGNTVRKLAERNGLTHYFKNDMAGKDWVSGFLARNPVIYIRTPEATAAARVRGFNKQTVGKFFVVLEPIVDQ